MPDESVCPKCGAAGHLSRMLGHEWWQFDCGTHSKGWYVDELTQSEKCRIAELTRDLAEAREDCRVLKLQNQNGAAFYEEQNKELKQRIADLELSVSSDGLRMNLVDSLREKRQQVAERDAEIVRLRELLNEAVNGEGVGWIIEAQQLLASRRQGEKAT